MSKEKSSHELFADLEVAVTNVVPHPSSNSKRAVGRAMDADPVEDMTGRLTSAEAAKKYMTAGNATVTLRSVKTGTRFTYRLRLKKLAEGETAGPRGQPIFVHLLTGPENTSDFQYLGHIFVGQMLYWHGRKSKISENAPGAKAFDWAWHQLIKGKLPAELEIWHSGTCGRCGRELTVPESVASGFGPECINHV